MDLKQLIPQKERLERYAALVRRTSFSDDKHLWDKACLTRVHGEQQSRSATIIMYLRPDGTPEFMFVSHGSRMDYLSMAVAIGLLNDLEYPLGEMMDERDTRRFESGVFKVRSEDDDYFEAVLQYVLDNLPQDGGVPLPVAYVSLETALDGRRRHLDFWCYKEVPMTTMWRLFRDTVVGGVIGV